MGFIYKIWNECNDKVYIGQTSVGIKTRWSKHLYNYLTNNSILYRAMRKYGAGVFHIEEIEECENEILNEREKYWIQYYDSYKNGYNSTPGGTALPSGKMFQRLDNKILFQLWDEGKSISEIQEQTGYSHTSILEHLKEYEKFSIEESILRGSQKSALSRSIAVSQWTTQGEFIKTFSSVKQAAETNNIAVQNIHKCLKKERQTAGGYYWTYENELPPKERKKQVYQYDKQGQLIQIYKNKAEAAKTLNLDSGSIAKVCQGKRKTCGGFIWKEE